MVSIRITNNEYPYPECNCCKDLSDCKHAELSDDGICSPLPPDVCPKPIEVMKNYVKLKKLRSVKPN